MPWAQLLRLVRAGGPRMISGLAKLWPLLLDAKTRAALLDAARNMASQSPSRRLHAKVDATVAIAEGIAEETDDEAVRQRAEGWARKGRNLSRRLDVPMQGRGASRANRKAVIEQLSQLQDEIAVFLGEA